MVQKTLTKKDIKDVLAPFAKAVQKDLNKISVEVVVLKEDMIEVKRDVSEIKRTQGELFIRLDRLIKIYEDQRSETILLSKQLKRLEERVAQLEAGK